MVIMSMSYNFGKMMEVKEKHFSIMFFEVNSFAVMHNYIAHTCVGAHLLGITRVGDTPYCVWLIVFTSDCCVGS